MEVIIDGVRYVPAQHVPTAKDDFLVGDFVRVCKAGINRYGEYGMVVDFEDGRVGVEFARPDALGHDLNGVTIEGHGWWYVPLHLEHADA